MICHRSNSLKTKFKNWSLLNIKREMVVHLPVHLPVHLLAHLLAHLLVHLLILIQPIVGWKWRAM